MRDYASVPRRLAEFIPETAGANQSHQRRCGDPLVGFPNHCPHRFADRSVALFQGDLLRCCERCGTVLTRIPVREPQLFVSGGER